MIRDHSAEMAVDARNNAVRVSRAAQRRIEEWFGPCWSCREPLPAVWGKVAIMALGEVRIVHPWCDDHWPEAEDEDVVKALGHEVEPGVWR